jgi:hypothetical protein
MRVSLVVIVTPDLFVPNSGRCLLRLAARGIERRRRRARPNRPPFHRVEGAAGCAPQPDIEQYAVADPAIAVVTSDADGAGTLTVGPVDGSEPTQTLAENSDISQLKSSGPSGLLGFVLTPLSDPDRGGDGQLHLCDPVTAKLITVSGFDGKPFEPLDWAFVPGTTSIVAQTADNSFYLIDPLTGRPIQPLGGHSKLYGFVPGSTTLIVDDNGDYKSIDLARGTTSTLPAIDLSDSAGNCCSSAAIEDTSVGWQHRTVQVQWWLSATATFVRSTPRIRIRRGNPRHLPFPQRSICRGREASSRCRHEPR